MKRGNSNVLALIDEIVKEKIEKNEPWMAEEGSILYEIHNTLLNFYQGKYVDRALSVKEMRAKHGISDADRKGSALEVEILSGKRVTNE